MNRRELFKTSTVAAVALLGIPKLGKTSVFAVNLFPKVEIGRNHGHALTLTLTDLVILLQTAVNEGVVNQSIQGQSGHPHTLSLNADELIQLLSEGSITKDSTTDFGHSHLVSIQLQEG